MTLEAEGDSELIRTSQSWTMAEWEKYTALATRGLTATTGTTWAHFQLHDCSTERTMSSHAARINFGRIAAKLNTSLIGEH